MRIYVNRSQTLQSISSSKCDIGDKARMYRFADLTTDSIYNFSNYFFYPFNFIKYFNASLNVCLDVLIAVLVYLL